MTTKQLAVLNKLVAYAVEHIPGDIGEDELEVAKIISTAARIGAGETRQYNYKTVDTPSYNLVAAAANEWADRGWRVVAAVARRGPEYGDRLILERPVDVSHPND